MPPTQTCLHINLSKLAQRRAACTPAAGAAQPAPRARPRLRSGAGTPEAAASEAGGSGGAARGGVGL